MAVDIPANGMQTQSMDLATTWARTDVNSVVCGEYSWPDGRTFCGQYRNDQKQGFGIFTWKDGRRFEGFWEQGKQHGFGVTMMVVSDLGRRSPIDCYDVFHFPTRRMVTLSPSFAP